MSLKSACRADRLARTFALSLPDWFTVRADECDRLEEQAKAKAEQAKKAAGIVPKGRDAWRPAAHNLKGRDWLTGRGAGPKAPAALRAPPGSTAVTGHVLTLDGKPLPKVTVRVGAQTTKTDSRGRFLLSGISAEATTLVVDGASAKTGVLDPALSHGDLLLHVTGSSTCTVRQAAEQMLRALPQRQVRWRVDGTRPESRVEEGRGLSRNPFHFTEGHGNPATAAEITERATVRTGQGEPSWAVGGSYQVIRIIRLATDFWDRDTEEEQERIIGRRRNGRWLDGTPSTDRAVFATDPHGKITPLDAHVRRAAPNPRTPPPMVRRSYNYHRAADDQGLIFSCFQSDLEKGFEAVQRRLQGEAMAKYTLTTGGGYFFVPPPGDAWLSAIADS